MYLTYQSPEWNERLLLIGNLLKQGSRSEAYALLKDLENIPQDPFCQAALAGMHYILSIIQPSLDEEHRIVAPRVSYVVTINGKAYEWYDPWISYDRVCFATGLNPTQEPTVSWYAEDMEGGILDRSIQMMAFDGIKIEARVL